MAAAAVCASPSAAPRSGGGRHLAWHLQQQFGSASSPCSTQQEANLTVLRRLDLSNERVQQRQQGPEACHPSATLRGGVVGPRSFSVNLPSSYAAARYHLGELSLPLPIESGVDRMDVPLVTGAIRPGLPRQPSTGLGPKTPTGADTPPAGSRLRKQWAVTRAVGPPSTYAAARHLEKLQTVLTSCFSYLPVSDVAVCGQTCRRWCLTVSLFWREAREAEMVVNTSDDMKHVLGALRLAVNARTLSLTFRCKYDDAMLSAVASACVGSLERIVIRSETRGHSCISGRGLQALVQRNSTTLTHLSVDDCAALKYLKLHSPSLASLELEGCASLEYLDLDACESLAELSLDMMHSRRPWALPSSLSFGVDPEGTETQMEKYGFSIDSVRVVTALMAQLAAARLPLVALHIATPLLTDAAVAALLADAPHELQRLSLTHCPFITDRSVSTIVHRCNELHKIDLSGCNAIGADAICSLCDTFCHTLSSLHIAACPRVTAQAVADAVSHAYNLQVLDLGHSLLDTSAGASSNLLRIAHPSLRVLSLWGCLAMQRLKLNCPNLEELNLRGCSRLASGRHSLDVKGCKLRKVHTAGCSDAVSESLAFGPSAKRVRHA